MAVLEMQTELIPVDLSAGIIAQVKVVETGREKVRLGTLLFDLMVKAIAQISQVVATPIQTAKPAKATMKYGLAVGGEAAALKNLAKLNQASDTFEIVQQYVQQALALVTELGILLKAECEVLIAELNDGGGLNEI